MMMKKKMVLKHRLEFVDQVDHTTQHSVTLAIMMDKRQTTPQHKWDAAITIQAFLRGTLQRQRQPLQMQPNTMKKKKMKKKIQQDPNTFVVETTTEEFKGSQTINFTCVPLTTTETTETTTTWKPPPPSMWCITYKQLMDFEKHAIEVFGEADYPSKTMRDICQTIIAPICVETKTSYALILNPKGLPIDTFISHSWDGCFAAFCRSIRAAFQTSVQKPNLWICAFALCQIPATISQQLGSSQDSLEQSSPFVQAIQQANTYCVVRNSHVDVYSRIWCVCELIYANHYGLYPARTHVTGPDVFAHLKTSVLDAQATSLEDRERILEVLLTQFNLQEIDEIVHQLRTQDEPETYLDDDDNKGEAASSSPLWSTAAAAAAAAAAVLAAAGTLHKTDDSPVPGLRMETPYGSKVPRQPPYEHEFQKMPNEAHQAAMSEHLQHCSHNKCRYLWRGRWGYFIGGKNGKKYFDLTCCTEGKRLNELLGWDYDDFRS